MSEAAGQRPPPDALIRQQSFDAITFSYLKRHYFEGKALYRRTMDEFVRAMRTGRMIAFTGSMTTEDRGYANWSIFAEKCFEAAEEQFATHEPFNRKRVALLRKTVENFHPRNAHKLLFRLDNRVGFSVIGETVDLAAAYSGQSHLNPNMRISQDLFLKRQPWLTKDTVLEALLHDLNIDRTITLNYDLEAELEYCSRGPPTEPGQDAMAALGRKYDDPRSDCLIKRLPDARSMASDIFNRERTDRLFEFAIGSADHEYHVLHLHGRADAFDSMVVSYRDYDRLYRRDGLTKAPFEHALKLLFAGNPILFVGIGMSEADVNRTLQDFVGNHPYRRIMPTFLLWNSYRKKSGRIDGDACDTFRIDMLHRLGVLTIFSHELAKEGASAPAQGKLAALRGAIVDLAAELKRESDARLNEEFSWRTMRQRAQESGLVSTWRVDKYVSGPPSPAIDLDELHGRLTVVVGRSGIGKGTEACRLTSAWRAANPDATALLLNGDFCFDTDSLLNLIGDFIRTRRSGEDGARMATMSRNQVLATPGAFVFDRPVLFVFIGVERLFGTNGEPLSAEFDEMVRQFATAANPAAADGRHRAGMVMFTTPRSRSYFEGIDAKHFKEIDLDRDGAAAGPSRYIEELCSSDVELRPVTGLIVEQKAGGSHQLSSYRRSIYSALIDPAHLERRGRGKIRGALAADILTVMAHVGQPVEADVLFVAPRIQRRLRQRDATTLRQRRSEFSRTMAWLEDKGLAIPIAAFREAVPAMPRYGLHSTLLSEIRERSGVPLSEAVLSTAFNMSLYTAQPADGPLPEAFLHDELGQLIDWMVGAYKDEPLDPKLSSYGYQRNRPDAVAALRAALAAVRGFYSTTTLLGIDRGDRVIGPERDGALTEHAERLNRLLAGFRRCNRRLDAGQIGPFYADELVWLFNEIGVVHLAQGNLYEARFAFDEADRFNRNHVEYGHRSHNWRRIMLNQIVVDIERARLNSAVDRIRQVEETIDHGKRLAIDEILEADSSIPLRTDKRVSHEEILATGLVAGYRGICAHIFGQTVDALEYFDRALEVLRRLDERRAYATFLRHRAALLRTSASPEGIAPALDLAVSAAESVRQMDLVHHSRIQRASSLLMARDVDAWARAGRQLHDALVYADTTDMYRVRVEARANLASASLASGDCEVALEHATDAMTVATRYGLSLRKISLRILIGRILVQRGDPQSGIALIEMGKAAAGRVGYQLALSSAQVALTQGLRTQTGG